jgi:hypothetical protein
LQLSGIRLVAAITAAWLIACGVLGARHQSQVAHVVDSAGRVHHVAHATEPHRDTTQSELRSAADRDDIDACAWSTIVHQAIRHTTAVAVSAVSPATVELASRDGELIRSSEIYRLAPKTSPPRA